MEVKFVRLAQLLNMGNASMNIPYIMKDTKAAGCESNILILGESGTGKEVFARAICKMSR
ncbi:sigma 54-interacting transcriptional regulator [Clostridium sp. AWRP]|uniref:sigma 54-interacting transcriptional regulator n=1 Tax=Clostridium sp. AWRP TaxID=2212991 RepID=UPI001FAAC164|nr:sigma 54-interacting transcriptional regulator [Clostridium sp. AWRP]